MEKKGTATGSDSYYIRPATAEDVDDIKVLLRSASVHTPSARRETSDNTGRRRPIRTALSKLLGPLISSGVDWQNIVVAISKEGELIGCCKVKPRKGGIREVASASVAKDWRGRGVALAGGEFIVAHFPHPLWGTCPSKLISFYKKFGAIEVTNPKKMPSFLRRRQRLVNIFLHLARKKSYLAVMSFE